MTVVATASRQLFAFARDEGLLRSSWLSIVSPSLEPPFNSIITTFISSAWLSLINIMSSVALNSTISLTTNAALYTYMCAIGSILWRRWSQAPLLPSLLVYDRVVWQLKSPPSSCWPHFSCFSFFSCHSKSRAYTHGLPYCHTWCRRDILISMLPASRSL